MKAYGLSQAPGLADGIVSNSNIQNSGLSNLTKIEKDQSVISSLRSVLTPEMRTHTMHRAYSISAPDEVGRSQFVGSQRDIENIANELVGVRFVHITHTDAPSTPLCKIPSELHSCAEDEGARDFPVSVEGLHATVVNHNPSFETVTGRVRGIFNLIRNGNGELHSIFSKGELDKKPIDQQHNFKKCIEAADGKLKTHELSESLKDTGCPSGALMFIYNQENPADNGLMMINASQASTPGENWSFNLSKVQDLDELGKSMFEARLPLFQNVGIDTSLMTSMSVNV